MAKFKDIIKSIFRISKNAIKGEVDEMKNLTPTEEDYAQGEVLATTAVTVMSGMGIGCSALAHKIIAKVFAYGIRDIKDGVEDNKKLIIGRVIEEIKKETAKAKDDN